MFKSVGVKTQKKFAYPLYLLKDTYQNVYIASVLNKSLILRGTVKYKVDHHQLEYERLHITEGSEDFTPKKRKPLFNA